MIKRLFVSMCRMVIKKRHNISSNWGGAYITSHWLNDYKKYGLRRSFKAHKYGFCVENWNFLKLSPINCTEYLTDVQYCNMHPINGQFSKWIDDKLTLKYLCAGTVLDEYLPEYYFQIDEKSILLMLPDYFNVSEESASFDDVLNLLKNKKELAVKKIAGSIGEGFYKAEYRDNNYYLNGANMSDEAMKTFFLKLKNYLIMEYLHPHQDIAKFCPSTANAIRYLTGRLNDKIIMIKGYIRFGTHASQFVENYNAGGVLCYLDNAGCFYEGNIINGNENRVIDIHPDSKEALIGQIPMWEEIVHAAELFGRYFPQMTYLGFDFVVTADNRVKLIEINSLTSLDGLELNGSILKTDAGAFYKQYL